MSQHRVSRQLYAAPPASQPGRLRRRPCAARAAASPLDALQFLFTGGARASAKKALLVKLADSQRGLRGCPTRAEVEAAVDALVAASPSSTRDTARLLSGCWRLVWTSERETLFLLQNGIPFVGAAAESYQTIELSTSSLANYILFGEEEGEEAAFSVLADCASSSPTRCDFTFTQAASGSSEPFRFAPFGKGYFETVYVDQTLRVSRDSRGDMLIVERVPYPPRLSALAACL